MTQTSIVLGPLLRNLQNKANPVRRLLSAPNQHCRYTKGLGSIETHKNKDFRLNLSVSEKSIRGRPTWGCFGDRPAKTPHFRISRPTYFLVLDPRLKKIVTGSSTKKLHTEQPPLSDQRDRSKRMHSYVQILTTPTADTPGTTLLLHFDDKRYIIGNISEGTQRACVQQKTGLAKVEDVLLTGKTSWNSNGGLLGMILTLADILATKAAAKKEKPGKVKKDREGNSIETSRNVKIYGTDNLTHLFATARRFVFRKGTPLSIIESQDSVRNADISAPSWSDNNIQVWAMDIAADQPSSRPSRKRSHDEISEGDDEQTIAIFDGSLKETIEERADRYAQIRRGVVGHMFGSNWQLDALIPKKLSEVVMPATIFVRNKAGKIEEYKGPQPGGDAYVADVDVLVRSPWPGASIKSLPPTSPSTLARSYIIKNHPQRGKFNTKAAIALGVKPGINFRELTMGSNVVTEAGNTVTPEMVLSPDKPGGGFAVVEIPSADYVEALLSRNEWSSEDVMKGVGAIFWILGAGVLADERLANFRAKFKHLKHIISSLDCCPNNLAFESAAMAQLKLHLVDSERFPIPAYSNSLLEDSPVPNHWTRAQVGNVLQLEPSFQLKEDKVIPYFDAANAVLSLHRTKGDPAEAVIFNGIDEEVLKLAQAAQKRINDPGYLDRLSKVQEDIPCKDAELITLGTGSSVPSKYRNVSATLLRVPGVGNYLFDCGENTLGQLKRVFGNELPQILRDLKAIWISHLHADHHLGTVSVLNAWNEETGRDEETKSTNIIVASEHGMHQWLAEYSQVEDFGYSRVNTLDLNVSNNWTKEFSREDTNIYGLSSIVACPVVHCHQALAVVFKFPNGFKVAYSGDCRPSSEFAKIGDGATVLIHEATFDNELQGDASAKKHCTTGEALWVAKKMRARRILLTHFSQRYQKIPIMDNSDDQIAIVAFDYMRCKVGDFAKVAEFRPALLKLYENEVMDE